MGKFEITKNFDVSRYVVPVATKILSERSSLGAIALANYKKRKLKPVTSTKPEFKEYFQGAIKAEIKTAVASEYFVDGAAKTLNIDTTNILVSDVISFQDKDKKDKGDIRVIVTEITDVNNCKVLLIGGSNTLTLAVGDYAYVDTNAHPEGSKANERRPMYKPATVFNYTQIVRGGHAISGTTVSTKNYDTDDIKVELKRQSTIQYTDNLSGLVTSTVRNSIDIAGKDYRIAGGLTFFARNNFDKDGKVSTASTVNVDSTGGALTSTKIDNGFQYFAENGGSADAILCSPAQARKISYLNPDKVNVNIINGDGTNPKTQGGATQVLKSPINFNGNMITKIYVDTRMPKDVVIMFNSKALFLIPMKDRAALQTTKEPSAENDSYSMDLLGEWTVRFENAKQNSYVITGLDI